MSPNWYGNLVLPQTPITKADVRAGVRALTGTPRQVPKTKFTAPSQYQLTDRKEGVADKIQNGVRTVLSNLGFSKYGASMGANRAFNFLNDLTPVGSAVSAEQAGKDWRQGDYLAALGNGAMAALGAVPDFGAVTGKVAHAIIAPLYHGSPHKFEKFALEKIGTGEGAQAYGHGLYFAENPKVATDYRHSLAGYPTATIDGEQIPRNLNTVTPELRTWLGSQYSKLNVDRSAGAGLSEHDVARTLDAIGPLSLRHAMARASTAAHAGDDVQEELLKFAQQAELAGERGSFGMDKAEMLAQSRVAKALAEQGNIVKNQPGHLYEVKLDANPEDFLDWDARLAEQPHHVSKLRQLNDLETVREQIQPFELGSSSGRSVYYGLSNALGGAPAATDQLKALGIPGLRYLDQGSRSAAQGTRNYVAFDPSIIDIVSRK